MQIDDDIEKTEKLFDQLTIKEVKQFFNFKIKLKIFSKNLETIGH